jgi:hypothetical protein
MKTLLLIPLLFLTACSTAPKLMLRPRPAPAVVDNSVVRFPEIIRAYHVGRYADPNDDLVMHEQHVVYRVEGNTRWDLRRATTRPANVGSDVFSPTTSSPRDVAFSPTPVDDAVLAEVNAQRLATVQIMVQSRTLSAALAQFQASLQQARTNLQETAVLRASLIEMKKRLDALEAGQVQPLLSPNSPTNATPDSLSP